MQLKNPQGALEHLEKAAMLKPDHLRAQLYFGALFLIGDLRCDPRPLKVLPVIIEDPHCGLFRGTEHDDRFYPFLPEHNFHGHSPSEEAVAEKARGIIPLGQGNGAGYLEEFELGRLFPAGGRLREIASAHD